MAFLILFLLLLSHQPHSATSSSDDFVPTVRSTLAEIARLVSVVSDFAGGAGAGLRLSSAVSDCLELLDLSSDEISAAIPAGAGDLPAGTGDRSGDLLSYLSAALNNPDTCHESVSDASPLLASLLASGLDSVSSLVSNTLRRLPPTPTPAPSGYPDWASEAAVGPTGGAMRADAVVAKDGSGNFTTVGEAVEAAPEKSERRFVIYVMEGVYGENVEVKKKKWNVMVVGDGMDVTVISGSRNFVDGWTTYRSATVGECELVF